MRLTVSGLHCQRGGRLVLAGLDFEARAGEALIVTGPNGAGKSSLLRALAGLVRISAGRIALEGGETELSVGEQSHFLGHLDPVKQGLTVLENLRFWMEFAGGDGIEVAEAAIVSVGLSDLQDVPGAYLSAGQRRRLSLARLIAVPRPVWLLDEPTSTLDAAGQARFAELVGGHLSGGGIAVAATHLPLGLKGSRELRLGVAA
jgi:heme exporter protein A